ncbi:MAG: VWA domain-containing protein [Polyangiaceae bacterium]|nr:VWA domain-containing protein [Polyangiaceae bacterium]
MKAEEMRLLNRLQNNPLLFSFALGALLTGCGQGNGESDGTKSGSGADAQEELNGGDGMGGGAGAANDGSSNQSQGSADGDLTGELERDAVQLPTGISWSYDPSLDLEAETCAAQSIAAEEIPLDVFIMLDRSGSMRWLDVANSDVAGAASCAVGSTVNARWCNAINAIDGFVRNPSSVGMGVAFATFAGAANSCQAVASLDTPLAVIQASDANGQRQAITNKLNDANPAGSTATEEALRTLISFSSDRQDQLAMAGENRKVINIIVTDGEPRECNQTVAQLNTLVVNHFEQKDIPTIFIGMTGLDETKLEAMAVNAGAALHTDYCEGDDTSCS